MLQRQPRLHRAMFSYLLEDRMDQTNQIANQLIDKVREYFPKPVRNCFSCRCEDGANGTPARIVIVGRFPNQLPTYDAKLLGLIGGKVIEQDNDSCLIQGKWQGCACRFELRRETLAAVCQ
jgi:hypothetical protein